MWAGDGIAEPIKPGTGAYNLACAAGQRDDRAGVGSGAQADAGCAVLYPLFFSNTRACVGKRSIVPRE